jgi:hypothetical protein
VGFLRARALTRWPGHIAEGALFFEFRHEQADAIDKSKDTENSKEVGERDVAVTCFEVLVALNGDSGTSREFGLGPIAPEALRTKAGQQRSYDDTLSSTH